MSVRATDDSTGHIAGPDLSLARYSVVAPYVMKRSGCCGTDHHLLRTVCAPKLYRMTAIKVLMCLDMDRQPLGPTASSCAYLSPHVRPKIPSQHPKVRLSKSAYGLRDRRSSVLEYVLSVSAVVGRGGRNDLFKTSLAYFAAKRARSFRLVRHLLLVVATTLTTD